VAQAEEAVMKVKATTSFAGQVCMAEGEVRDVPEDIAAPLLDCGYLEAVEPEQKKRPAKKKSAKDKTED